MTVMPYLYGGSTNLNDQSTYFVLNIGLPTLGRTEIWVKPPVQGAAPILGGYFDDVGTFTVDLRIKAASIAALKNAVNSVRTLFVNSANTITYSLDGVAGNATTYTTYPTVIVPVDLASTDGLDTGIPTLYLAAGQFLVPRWSFSVTVSPVASPSVGAI